MAVIVGKYSPKLFPLAKFLPQSPVWRTDVLGTAPFQLLKHLRTAVDSSQSAELRHWLPMNKLPGSQDKSLVALSFVLSGD